MDQPTQELHLCRERTQRRRGTPLHSGSAEARSRPFSASRLAGGAITSCGWRRDQPRAPGGCRGNGLAKRLKERVALGRFVIGRNRSKVSNGPTCGSLARADLPGPFRPQRRNPMTRTEDCSDVRRFRGRSIMTTTITSSVRNHRGDWRWGGFPPVRYGRPPRHGRSAQFDPAEWLSMQPPTYRYGPLGAVGFGGIHAEVRGASHGVIPMAVGHRRMAALAPASHAAGS
jgi:hypothetical protein